jgi:hypothetical protein
MSFYSDYDYQAQQRAEQQRRAVAIGQRIGQLDAAISMVLTAHRKAEADAEQRRLEADWARRQQAAQPAPAPAPATPQADDHWPTYAEVQAFARAPRKVEVQSIRDPMIFSPGANVRIR